MAPPAKTAFQIKTVLDIPRQQQLSISYHQFSPAVFALPVVKPIYQLMFLATSPFSPHLSHTPTFNLLPPVAISSSAPTIPNVLPVSHPKPVFTAPSPQRPPGPTEQEIRCSSIARLVHKTCLQGQASGLEKISTFWRFASGSSLSKGSIFFATLAGTASTLSSCAPAHSAPVPPICNVMGLNHPTAFPVTVK